MATTTNYRNILLKDAQGNPLLPITLSYYVEYKDGVSVKSKLDNLGADVEYTKSYIDTINSALEEQDEFKTNITKTLNQVIASYIAKPDHANEIGFDNTYAGLSDAVKNLNANTTIGNETIVTTQRVIEVIDSRLAYTEDYVDDVNRRLTTTESYIDSINSSITSIDSRVTELEGDVTENTTYISEIQQKLDTIFDDGGTFVAYASNIQYNGSAAAGTDGDTNVQDAIDSIGAKLEGFNTEIDALINAAGVTYVRGAENSGVLIASTTDTTPEENEYKQGSLSISLNLGTEGKLKVDDGIITVDDSKLSITSSQITGYISSDMIEGGLGADNINITYTYTDAGEVEHNDGEKTVQEFYNETQTTLTEIQNSISALDTNYAIDVTSDTDSAYARVYTISQGENEFTINIPKDQFLKNVNYVTYNESYALVFEWMLPDEDETTGAPYTYIPIDNFIEAITSEIAGDVTELQTNVQGITDRLDSIESAGYITGATVDGASVTVNNGVLEFTYLAMYEQGGLTEGVSGGFLESMGIS